MPNVVTQKTIVNGSKKTVVHIAVDSDGSEETALVVYDSSALATEAGIVDPLNCKIKKVTISSSSLTAQMKLLFDATTDVLAVAIPSGVAGVQDFKSFGGIKNTAGTGKTGDILLTTLGLAAGDSFTLVLEVDKV